MSSLRIWRARLRRDNATPDDPGATRRDGGGERGRGADHMGFLVYENARLSQVLRLAGTRGLIGRSADSWIRVHDRNASREHCLMTFADGVFRLTDLGSTNGTFVDGRRIGAALLGPGDEIDVGQATIKAFELDATAALALPPWAEHLYLDPPTGLLNRRGLRTRIRSWLSVIAPAASIGVLAIEAAPAPRHAPEAATRLAALDRFGQTMHDCLPLQACAARVGESAFVVLVLEHDAVMLDALAARLGNPPAAAATGLQVAVGTARGGAADSGFGRLLRQAEDALLQARARSGAGAAPTAANRHACAGDPSAAPLRWAAGDA